MNDELCRQASQFQVDSLCLSTCLRVCKILMHLQKCCDKFRKISLTPLQATASDIAIDISELIVFHSGQMVRLTFSSRKWFKYSFQRGWAGSGPFHERMMDN